MVVAGGFLRVQEADGRRPTSDARVSGSGPECKCLRPEVESRGRRGWKPVLVSYGMGTEEYQRDGCAKIESERERGVVAVCSRGSCFFGTLPGDPLVDGKVGEI